jgi:hypothetical protein
MCAARTFGSLNRTLAIIEFTQRSFDTGYGQTTESAVTFKGRQQTFRQLENALGGRQRSTLLLVGPRRTGKTSLLHQLPHRLGSQIIPVFLDLQASNLGSNESSAGLISGMMEEIAGNAR